MIKQLIFHVPYYVIWMFGQLTEVKLLELTFGYVTSQPCVIEKKLEAVKMNTSIGQKLWLVGGGVVFFDCIKNWLLDWGWPVTKGYRGVGNGSTMVEALLLALLRQ